MKKLIISDFFGVIGDECAPVYFKNFFPDLSPEELTERYFYPGDRGEVSFEEICQNVSKDLNVDAKILKHQFLDAPKPHNEYISLLRILKKKGHRIVLLSNACDYIVPYLINKFSINDLFDETYISYKIGCTKPSKEAFEYVLKKEGYQPKDAIFIDDNAKNVAASKEYGISGVLFRNNEESLAKIEKEAEGELK